MEGPPEAPPLPGGPLVGVPPMFTPGVLPGTDAGLGLPGTAWAGRSSMSGARGTGPGDMDGAVTPVFPAPPLGASFSAKADPASSTAAQVLKTIVTRAMDSSVYPYRRPNSRHARKFKARAFRVGSPVPRPSAPSSGSDDYRFGAPDTIRTCDLCLRRATLYPAELRVLTEASPTASGGRVQRDAERGITPVELRRQYGPVRRPTRD